MEFSVSDLLALGVLALYWIGQMWIGDWASTKLSRGQAIPTTTKLFALLAPWVIAAHYAFLLLPPSPNRNILFTDLDFLVHVGFTTARPVTILLTNRPIPLRIRSYTE